MDNKSLQRTTRLASLLGLLALSLTAELRLSFLGLAWICWFLSWYVDRHPSFQEKMRPLDSIAVILMVGLSLTDFFALRSTIFVSLAHFLLLFQSYKLIGRKQARDCQQILFFTFFQVLSACTLAADIWQAGILMGLIPAAAVGLFWHQVAVEEEKQKSPVDFGSLQRLQRLAWVLGLGALPVTLSLTVGVFVFFPRLNWNLRIPGFSNDQIGYAEEVNLTRTGELGGGDSIVLWLRFADEPQRLAWKGYLRGATFDSFDGLQWKPSGAWVSKQLRPDSQGLLRISSPQATQRWEADITLLDTGASTLFSPGIPYQVRVPLQGIETWVDESLHFTMNWQRPLRYLIWTTDLTTGTPDEISLQAYLRLPTVSDRVRLLAEEQAGSGSTELQAFRLETYLKTTFGYSLNRGDRVAVDPVDDFLFNRRQGPCGHFASAMAVLLRVQGIPSRVVVGYLGGEWNPMAGQLAIRQKDAHAWVEAFIQDKGWVRLDPTPRPRDSASSSNALARGWLGVRQGWDYLSLKWNAYVVEYDLHTQVQAIQKIQESPLRFEQWMNRWTMSRTPDETQQSVRPDRLLRPVFYAILALLFLSMLYRISRPRRPEDFYRRFLNRMARQGYPKAASETGWEYAERLYRRFPEKSTAIKQLTSRYYEIRFAR